MSKYNLDTFLALIEEAKEANNKTAETPEAEALIAAGAAASEAAGGPGVAAQQAEAEARGQAAGQAAVAEHAAAVGDETAPIDAQMGDNAQDAKTKLERKLELLAGTQVQADASMSAAEDTARVAPMNAVNMAKNAEEGEDQLVGILAQIHDQLSKEASEDEADEAMKVASEAVQYGRYMALGFLDALQDSMIADEGSE